MVGFLEGFCGDSSNTDAFEVSFGGELSNISSNKASLLTLKYKPIKSTEVDM